MAYALLTAEPPYADDTNPWVRFHGFLVPDARVVEGGDPTPDSFIRACMVMGPQGRKPPRALAAVYRVTSCASKIEQPCHEVTRESSLNILS